MRAVAVAIRRVPRAGGPLPALPEAERALLGPGAAPKRRGEFAAGRAAARAALSRLLGPPANGCVVLRDARRGTARPVPVSAAGRELPAFVSITHASGRAVAIAGWRPLGVDLVELEPVDRAFREEAFSADEIAAWEAFLGERPGSDRAACTAFAAKEAVVKWLGTGLALPLRSVRSVPAGRGRAGRLGRLPGARFALDLHAPGLHRRLEGLLATPGRLVLIAVR